MLRHGSLFSGIGGFDLASEWMGWENSFHCEWNPFGQKVLKYYWPNAISYDDITKTDFTIHRGHIDILTGGFPCQPYSTAGKRKGKEDERHLWPSMLRAIREIRPRWVVGENVRGLVSWDGGLVFEEVQAELEAEGYEVQPFLLPAASVNAPHRRDRVWFVAYSNNQGGCGEPREVPIKDGEVSERNNHAEPSHPDIQRNAKDSNKDGWGGNEWEKESNIRQQWDIGSGDNERLPSDYAKVRNATYTSSKGLEGGTGESIQRGVTRFTKCSNDEDVADSNSEVLEYGYGKGKAIERAHKEERTKSFSSPGEWATFPTVSPICSRNDGLSNRLDGITFPKWRNESIKAGGNAIVPQVALQIFKSIQKYESNY